ncbi:ATP-binding protein [Streptomyces chartreusis]|uniref:ATP-binding protein n=1 Tax=Streptomyces chartreusis TaxID=1969 RepID=UPI0036574600
MLVGQATSGCAMSLLPKLSKIARQLDGVSSLQAREVWHLPGTSHRAPGLARAHVAETCRSWQLPAEVKEDLLLIVSELATNAVVHAPNASFTVSFLLTADAAHVVVIDQGICGSPSDAPLTPDGEGGRGVALVQALASRFVSNSSEKGTVAWASVAFTSASASYGWSDLEESLAPLGQVSLAA